DERLAAVFDRHANHARARIERILDELLHDRGRPLDDLACRDLVRDAGGQNRDLRRHRGTTSAASTQPRTPSCRSTPRHAPPRPQPIPDQLLPARGRPLADRACRDLVRDAGGQNRDLRRHRGTTSAASTQPRTPSCRSTRSHAPARRSTYSAAPASSVMAALAAPYGATRTGVPGLAITATGRARCRHSRAASPPHAAVASPNTISAMPRRRAATASHSPTHPAAAPRAHSPGVARPVASNGSLAASGGGRNRRARSTSGARGVRRAAIAHAAAALPSAPARYSVAPRLYHCAAT